MFSPEPRGTERRIAANSASVVRLSRSPLVIRHRLFHLILRGICWTADEPIDRLNDLVLPGTRVSD